MRRYTGIVLLALLATAVSHAEVYRWVDKEGVVHYSSQRPASGYERVEVDVTPAADDAAQRRAESARQLEANSAERAKTQAASAEAAAKLAENQQRCEAARAQIEKYESAPPVRFLIPQADGSDPVRMTEEEHAARLSAARERAAESCG